MRLFQFLKLFALGDTRERCTITRPSEAGIAVALHINTLQIDKSEFIERATSATQVTLSLRPTAHDMPSGA